MWYCPALYNQAITNTFLDEQVFRTSEDSPLSHQYDVYLNVAAKLPDYQWAFPQRGRIPQAYILPKRKKAFRKGRPIVAFLDTMGRKLWEALADVLQMTQQACPDALHQGDGITQLTQTAAFLRERDKQHDPNNYILFNQDLAGFSTSLDKDRFLSAYSNMARWYRDKNHQHADTFYIDHCQKAPSHRVHGGKSRQKQQEASSGSKLGIHLKDIPQLISAVLLLNYFVVGQTLIEQFRGAPMGSPCSPALCNLVVAVEEQCWHHTYAGLFFNHKFHQHSPHQHAIYFATRYVDNRVLLLPEQLLSLPPFKQLTSASFYKPPVQLETEPANIFLGFAVDPNQRTVIHQSQLTTADIIHPRSATTAQTLRSSFQARTRLINRVTHPHEATFPAIRAMRGTYQAAGYVDSQL